MSLCAAWADTSEIAAVTFERVGLTLTLTDAAGPVDDLRRRISLWRVGDRLFLRPEGGDVTLVLRRPTL